MTSHTLAFVIPRDPLRPQAISEHLGNACIRYAVFGENERVPLINNWPTFDQLATHIGDAWALHYSSK